MSAIAQAHSASIFRIDSFAVPAESRQAFLAQVDQTKAFLAGQAGCVQNLVLERHSGADRYNIVTVVEWESEAAFAKAKAAMMESRQKSGFNPETFLRSLGVDAHMSNYVAAS